MEEIIRMLSETSISTLVVIVFYILMSRELRELRHAIEQLRSDIRLLTWCKSGGGYVDEK